MLPPPFFRKYVLHILSILFKNNCDYDVDGVAAANLEKRSWGNVRLHLGNESHYQRVFGR